MQDTPLCVHPSDDEEFPGDTNMSDQMSREDVSETVVLAMVEDTDGRNRGHGQDVL